MYVNKMSQHSVLTVQKSAALRRLTAFKPPCGTQHSLGKKLFYLPFSSFKWN